MKRLKNPGCADACPTGAILFGEREELIKVARERIRKYPDRYIDHLFGEHEFGGTSWMVLAGMPFGEIGLHDNAGPTPLPELTSSFLSVVPLIVALYPGLLAGFYAFTKRKDRLSEDKVVAAVTEAVARADEETKKMLEAATQRAESEKERAIAQAVEKALKDAETKATEQEESK